MNSLVSILIPVYNSQQWLAETVESALAQTWQNKEIIIVNDGSKDNSLAIAKSFESPIIKIISQENRGASAARNQALQAAQGNFIQYLDADDLLLPDKIKLQIQLLENSNSDYVAAGEWSRFYTKQSEALFIPQPLWADMSPIEWLICAWEGNWMMHPAAWLVPRHIVEQAGSWNVSLSLNDDGEYFFRVVLASKGVKFCQGARSFYRSGIRNSLSGSKSRTAWESAFHSLQLCTNYLLTRENSPRTRRVCASVFQRFIYDVYPEAPELIQKAEAKVKQLGGSDVKPFGGSIFQLLSKVVGWKQAKRIHRLAYRYGYGKVAGGKMPKRLPRLAERSDTTT